MRNISFNRSNISPLGSPASLTGTGLQSGILLLDLIQLSFELVDLGHVLVLDPEVVHLDLNVADLSTKLVLLLSIADDSIEHSLEVLHFVVDLLDLLIFRLFEDSLLDLVVNLLDFFNGLDRGFSHFLDLLEQVLDLPVLAL